MKPSDDPEFYRRPAPEGRSRESTLRLDAHGQFWHDGERVGHSGLASGLRSWIGRHPDNGRYVLSNGYDWTYFSVEDVPFFVESLREGKLGAADSIALVLSDGTEERWDPRRSRVSLDGILYATVKDADPQGPYEARFSRHALAQLGPRLVDSDRGPLVQMGSNLIRLHIPGSGSGSGWREEATGAKGPPKTA